MALESFYGGKQGVSPVIKARFKYINKNDPSYESRAKSITEDNLTTKELLWLKDFYPNFDSLDKTNWTADNWLKPFTMDECLKDVNYTDVWYGELCIIDTDSKMNPNNGKVFRRTLKQTGRPSAGTYGTLYAEYVGQIVGPSGGIPNINFSSLDGARRKAAGLDPTVESDKDFMGVDGKDPLDISEWDFSYSDATDDNAAITYDNIENRGKSYLGKYQTDGQGGNDTDSRADDYHQIAVLNSASDSTDRIQLVPGKDSNGNYHDNIRYTWCNVRRTLGDNTADAWIYLGFEIPYTTFDAEGIEENYTYNGNIFIDSSDESHPFYKNYEFHIPRGARGIGPEEIFCINPKDLNTRNLPEGAKLYTYDAINYSQGQDKYIVDQNKTKTVSNTDSYWVGKWCIYNPKVEFTNTINTDVIYVYLGSYKDIRTIQLGSDGTLTFTYSDNSTYIPNEKLTWITSASVNNDPSSNEYGQFTVIFNNENIPEIDKNLHLIKNVKYTDSTGEITFNYSGNFSQTTGDIIYPKQININTDKNSNDYGKVTAYENIDFNNNGELKNGATLTEITTLPLIKQTTYDNNTGEIVFTYSGIGNQKVKINDIKATKIENGQLFIQFRIPGTNNSDNEGWKNLGQVVTKPAVGPVLQITNTIPSTDPGASPDDNFVNPEDAINLLNTNGYTDPNDGDNTYADTNGNILVNGEDATGGFVSFSVSNGDEINTYLAYYDPIKEDWVNIGLVGGSSTNEGAATNISSKDASTTDFLIWDETTEIQFDNDGNNTSMRIIPLFPWEQVS